MDKHQQLIQFGESSLAEVNLHKLDLIIVQKFCLAVYLQKSVCLIIIIDFFIHVLCSVT